ncbi:COR domain-containing protein [Rubinisphaera sp.]|uniref:COR domain-containing protein n=1 Tax=Rubinisphaera sp. TaxID=2024857 RepID=UPI0025EEC597|nr:COR domain-containing protein [Rubinisphaera sp.]
MTTITTPILRALFSEDGQAWHDGTPVNWEPDESISKFVIGTPLGSDREEKTVSVTESLPSDLAIRFPNLTHLHLWQIENLTALPKLPPGLKCLDIQGCKALESVSRLPDTVETLSFSMCTGLRELPNVPVALERLYLDGCTSLEEDILAVFFLELSRVTNSQLVEFDGRQVQLTSIKRLPRTLRRLVLEGCTSLTDVSSLPEFENLQHLNLSDCPNLKKLPNIPDHLQYVQLYGSEQLQDFLGQHIGVYDRGTKDQPNVADVLYTRRKFGDELSIAAHAKLLLLGDGRVGKSTLAKRLQWDCLTKEQQQSPEWEHLKPKVGEKYSHKVRFSKWETPLQLAESTASEVNLRAVANRLATRCDESGKIDGTIRIWDFGGQEIYHQTHRIFAAEGSVYLIVWSPNPPEEKRLMQEYEEVTGATQEEWREWNRQRSLDYWLDYVDSLKTNAQVALVCTNTAMEAPHFPWTKRSETHKDREIECFYIDSVEEECPNNPEYIRLLKFIREASGSEATRIGLVQPAFYSEVADYVDHLLDENDAAWQDPNRQPEHLILDHQEWSNCLIENHAKSHASRHQLELQDIDAITGYLHSAGQIFEIRDSQTKSILIDQSWATDIIYKMLRPALKGDHCLFNIIRENKGYFREAALGIDQNWQTLRTDAERHHILQYMQQCGMIIPIQSQEERRDESTLYLATEKWLLPAYSGELAKNCETVFNLVRDHQDGAVMEEFSFEQMRISEFDFRALIVHLGNILRTRAVFFREGLQATDNPLDPSWCFQLRWKSEGVDTYYGNVDARLATSQRQVAQLTEMVEEVFHQDGSPLARWSKSLKREYQPLDDFSHLYFREITTADLDVAISYSGGDADLVKSMVAGFRKLGIRRIHEYRDPQCRYEELIKVLPFMESLRNPPCLVLVLSDSYLNPDPSNWFCVWEFADAVRRLADEQVTRERLIVTYRNNQNLTSDNLREVASEALSSMAKHFDSKYDKLIAQHDRNTALEYRDRADHFHEALSGLNQFAQEFSSDGTYSFYKIEADESLDFSEMANLIKKTLKGGQSH